jgi:hypothetical protein
MSVNGEVVPIDDPDKPKKSVVQVRAEIVQREWPFISFRGQAMVKIQEPFPHWVPLYKDRFERLAYPLLGGPTRGQVADAYAYVENTAPDKSEFDYLIMFGAEQPTDEQLLAPGLPAKPQIWNTRELCWDPAADPDDCVWRSPYPPIPAKHQADRLEFVMQLAGHDEGVYDDIMQSIAPIVMEKKPDGAIWWVGDGANGKSTLMDALYRIFPDQLASLTVKALVDERDTPLLNGQLANIVRESSEGRIEDTMVYKAIGTHENFRTHKFHSQETYEIRGNMHHIFSANNIPLFADKGHSARRRTFIIPFRQRFVSDPLFEEKTFTPEFFGRLITEICKYAKQIERQGYKYKWSAITLAAKLEYDESVNTAEAYVAAMIEEGIVAFDNIGSITDDYIRWCKETGNEPLRAGHLKKALKPLSFERISTRLPGKSGTPKIYRLPGQTSELITVGLWRDGLYTTPGFQPAEPPADIVTVPADFTQSAGVQDREQDGVQVEPEKVTILEGKW